MSLPQYGVMAGLTVYAVPQVLAATLPIGALSNQIGTVVKLVRVLMLGPVVLLMSLVASKLRDKMDEPEPEVSAGDRPKRGRPALHQLVPWFIVGFLLVAGERTTGLIPTQIFEPTAFLANILTTVLMAALGLGVDIRVVAKAGLRVTGSGHRLAARSWLHQLRPHPPRRGCMKAARQGGNAAETGRTTRVRRPDIRAMKIQAS